MSHKINTKVNDILVIIGHRGMLLLLQHLNDRSAQTSFNGFHSLWISISDTMMYVPVDHGSGLCMGLMKWKLYMRRVNSYPFQSKNSSVLGLLNNFIATYTKILIGVYSRNAWMLDTATNFLLADVKIGWNFTEHTNNTLPHFHRFGVLPKVFESLSENFCWSERTTLMNLARNRTETIRIPAFISRSIDFHYRHIAPFKSFSVHEKVWLHRHRYWWQQCTVSSINSSTIMIKQGKKLYSTQEVLVCIQFREIFFPLALENDQLTQDHPVHIRWMFLSNRINPVFPETAHYSENLFDFEIQRTSCFIAIFQRRTFDIGSISICLTITKVFKKYGSISEEDSVALGKLNCMKLIFYLKKP